MYKIIGSDQREYGPISAEQLREWISQRRANGATLIQPEGATGWQPLSSFPEFADAMADASRPVALPPAELPNDFLAPSVVVSICCCTPVGLLAMYYAVQCRTQIFYKDYESARVSAKRARMWFWIALVLGIPTMIVLGFLRYSAMTGGLGK